MIPISLSKESILELTNKISNDYVRKALEANIAYLIDLQSKILSKLVVSR